MDVKNPLNYLYILYSIVGNFIDFSLTFSGGGGGGFDLNSRLTFRRGKSICEPPLNAKHNVSKFLSSRLPINLILS